MLFSVQMRHGNDDFLSNGGSPPVPFPTHLLYDDECQSSQKFWPAASVLPNSHILYPKFDDISR